MSRSEIEKVRQFYNDRHKQFGDEIASVGWNDKQTQDLRFEVLLRGIDLKGKTILDVGCGLGDLYYYLTENGNQDFKYIGLDISDSLIESAKKRVDAGNAEFFCGTVDEYKPNNKVDISVLSGALTYKVEDNMSLARDTLTRMNELSSEAVCSNFLTKYVDYEIEKNFHYSPEEIFSFCKTLTRSVNIYHDYPLWEFTVQFFNH